MELHDIMKEPWLPSDATVSLIQSIGEEVDYRRGSLLVEQGKRSYYFYIIKKGMCRSFYSDENYEDTNLFAKDGDIIGSVTSYFGNLPAKFSVEALTDLTVLRVSFSDLKKAMDESVELTAWVRDLLFGQINCLERRYAYRSARDNSYERYVLLIERWEHTDIKNVPLKYIAQYLQITPQMLSKIRKKYLMEH